MNDPLTDARVETGREVHLQHVWCVARMRNDPEPKLWHPDLRKWVPLPKTGNAEEKYLPEQPTIALDLKHPRVVTHQSVHYKTHNGALWRHDDDGGWDYIINDSLHQKLFNWAPPPLTPPVMGRTALD